MADLTIVSGFTLFTVQARGTGVQTWYRCRLTRLANGYNVAPPEIGAERCQQERYVLNAMAKGLPSAGSVEALVRDRSWVSPLEPAKLAMERVAAAATFVVAPARSNRQTKRSRCDPSKLICDASRSVDKHAPLVDYQPKPERALAIAIFYAVGTAIGGLVAPLLFGILLSTHSPWPLAGGYLLAAILMIGAAIVEAFFGVDAEGRSLEDIADPRSAG